MSVVIVGGNERMSRQYKDLCREYNYKAKVYPKALNGLRSIGTPDLLVIFTGTVSHKMVRCALNGAKSRDIRVARSHTSSIAALKSILEQHAGEEGKCRKISL